MIHKTHNGSPNADNIGSQRVFSSLLHQYMQPGSPTLIFCYTDE